MRKEAVLLAVVAVAAFHCPVALADAAPPFAAGDVPVFGDAAVRYAGSYFLPGPSLIPDVVFLPDAIGSGAFGVMSPRDVSVLRNRRQRDDFPEARWGHSDPRGRFENRYNGLQATMQVPEPPGLILLGLALVGLAAWSQARRRKSTGM